TLSLNEVSAKSPSDWPKPGKSKRKHAIPNPVNCLLTRAAPGVWRWPAKQCAKIAYALGGESGKSMVPAIRWPAADENVTFADCSIYRITGWVLVGLAFPTRVNINHTSRVREME